MADLLELANDVRARFHGKGVAVEVLFNAKRGGCSEDCNFCSQSGRFTTDVELERLSSIDEFVEAAHDAHQRGAGEFCMVVAVRGPSRRLLDRLTAATRRIKEELPLKVAVSLGILNEEHMPLLLDAGVDKINHNLETSRRYFPQICTTHIFDERWETCQRVKRYGFELCSSGIIGMGETIAGRVDFLCTLQLLEPEEVPINLFEPAARDAASRSLLDGTD
jgi:biotin synthase